MFRILIITLFFYLHPVHVTVLSLDYSTEEKALKGFLKVHYDDFLLDVAASGLNSSEVDLNGDIGKSKEVIHNYLGKRVMLSTGQSSIKPEISAVNLTGNELKIDLGYRMEKNVRSIRIVNNILSDIYADQTNMVLIKYGSFEEGIKLTSKEREHVFNIKQAE